MASSVASSRRSRPAGAVLAFADARLLAREDALAWFNTPHGLLEWPTFLERYNGVRTRLINHAPLLNLAAILPTEAQGVAFVQALVNGGMDPNPPFTGQDWPLPAFGVGLRIQDTPLTAAIRAERPALVKALLDLGANPAPRVPAHLRNLTPDAVLFAAERDACCLQHLLDAGGSPHAVDHHGQSALVRAVLKGNTGSVVRLIAAGADVTAPVVRVDRSGTWGGYSILHAAMALAPLEMLDALIAAGAPLTTRDPWRNETPLDSAVLAQSLWSPEEQAPLLDRAMRRQRVERLLDAGAPLDDPSDTVRSLAMPRSSPLFRACEGGALLDWGMIDLLLTHGADLYRREDQSGETTPMDALKRSLGVRASTNRADAHRLEQTLRLQEAQDLRRAIGTGIAAVPGQPRTRL